MGRPRSEPSESLEGHLGGSEEPLESLDGLAGSLKHHSLIRTRIIYDNIKVSYEQTTFRAYK